jgi:hypothetical protein
MNRSRRRCRNVDRTGLARLVRCIAVTVAMAFATAGFVAPAASASVSVASSSTAATTAPCQAAAGPFVSRDGSVLCADSARLRFGGANIYWLGLDQNVGGIAYPTYFRITDALETAREMGATVVRCQTCGISTGNPLSVEPSLNDFNSSAFNSIDYTLYAARKLGLRVTIPLTDYWDYYLGSVYNFAQWLGQPACTSDTYACPAQAEFFYTNPRAIKAFESYIAHLVNHVNRYTGVAYKDDPTVMYWELCNECNNMPASWIDTISAFIHRIAPHQLVAAGQQFGINPATLTAPGVDVVDVHYYPPTPAQVEADAAQITAAGKVYVAGEYASTSASSTLTSAIAGDPNVTGANFWSLFAHNDTYGYVQHDDGFTVHFPGDNPAMQQEDEQIRDLDYAMTGSAVPPLPAPGQPLITSITKQGADNVLAWRGSTDASDYTVLRSQHGPDGPWTSICDQCATDNDTPWTDTSTPSGTVWYKVVPFAPDGRQGPASPVTAAGNASETLVDPVESWQFTLSHTTNVYLDGSDPGKYDGFLSRLAVTPGSGTGTVTWAQLGLQDVTIKALYQPGTSPVAVQVSADGSNWTSVQPSVAAKKGRLLHVLHVSGLQDANFVRLVLTSAGRQRAGRTLPEVAEVTLQYALPLAVDDETSWSASYAHSGGGALTFDTSNPQYFGGDASRAERQYGTPYIEWQLPVGATAFQATAFYWPSQQVQPFTVEVSADGSTWTTVSPVVTGGTGNWLVYTYTLYNLNGDKFVQLVWPAVPNGGQSFSPELGDVDIYG